MTATPTAIDQAQQELIEEFALFSDWSERYQHLIDLGRQLPAYPEAQRDDTHRVQGCQSQVWLCVAGDARQLDFRAASDGAIVAGLLALLLRVYSGQSAQTILATPPAFIEAIGLGSHLSMTRRNGLAAVLTRIRAHATAALAATESSP
ncbi:MAG: SufE family protein [Xanthomonadales bacterium]|jgi:cysteine desulfuration protein SufE|nr:SufE family protein [Xanthomonadales bacterium]